MHIYAHGVMSGRPLAVVEVVVVVLVAMVDGKEVKVADGSTVFFINSRRFSSSLFVLMMNKQINNKLNVSYYVKMIIYK